MSSFSRFPCAAEAVTIAVASCNRTAGFEVALMPALSGKGSAITDTEIIADVLLSPHRGNQRHRIQGLVAHRAKQGLHYCIKLALNRPGKSSGAAPDCSFRTRI